MALLDKKSCIKNLNNSDIITLKLFDGWRVITINKSEGIIEEIKSKFNGKYRICVFDITKKVQNMYKLENNPKVKYNFDIVLSKIFKSKTDDRCVNFLGRCKDYIEVINL